MQSAESPNNNGLRTVTQQQRTVNSTHRHYGTDNILLVSGREISSFRLTLGSLTTPPTHSSTQIFFKVIAVQLYPLFHNNTLSNCARHASNLRVTALHVTTGYTVADVVSHALDAYTQQTGGGSGVGVTLVTGGG